MNPMDRPIANPIVVLREEFDDWAVLFNPDTADALGINPVGVAIWKGLVRGKNLGEIVSEIKDNFEGVPEAAPEEIAAFVDKLAKDGFLGHELKHNDS